MPDHTAVHVDPLDGHPAAGRWRQFEEALWPGQYTGTAPADTVTYIPATTRRWLLLTAPHAVAHYRQGRRKGADVATGGLAAAVAHRVGAHALIATGAQRLDPNFHDGGPFKDQVAHLIAGPVGVVIDIHGMPDDFGVDVCLGTGRDQAMSNGLLGDLQPALAGAGLAVSVNEPYGAYPEHTVTNTSHRAGVPAIQVEVSRCWRSPWDRPADAEALVQILADAIGALQVPHANGVTPAGS